MWIDNSLNVMIQIDKNYKTWKLLFWKSKKNVIVLSTYELNTSIFVKIIIKYNDIVINNYQGSL